MPLQYDDVWEILGPQREVSDDWFDRAKAELEYGDTIQNSPANSSLVDEFNNRTTPANTVRLISRPPKFYATKYSRSGGHLLVEVSLQPDPKRINIRNQFDGYYIHHDTPFFWLVSNERQYKVDDVLLYFFKVMLVAQAFSSLVPLETVKRAFGFFGIIRRNEQNIDLDDVCGDMQALAGYFGYAATKDGVFELTQKGRIFLRDKGVNLDWPPLTIEEQLETTEPTATVMPFDDQISPSAPNGRKSRTHYNISIAEAAKACGKSPKTIERWLAGKNTPSGFPGLNDSGAFLAFVEMYKGRKAIFSPRHRSGNMQKTKHGYNYLPDALPADDGTDT
jgi:hypothetical protein